MYPVADMSKQENIDGGGSMQDCRRNTIETFDEGLPYLREDPAGGTWL